MCIRDRTITNHGCNNIVTFSCTQHLVIRSTPYFAAIGIGFEYSSYNFTEPLSNVLSEVFIAKENGRVSEQTFIVVIQLFYLDVQLNESDDEFVADIPNTEYQGVVKLEFSPSQQRINSEFSLLQGNVTERAGVFLASSAPADSATGPNGEIFHTPTYLSPINLFTHIFIYIEDSDSKFV